jgi:hypothetical protein
MTDIMSDFKDKRFAIVAHDLFPENPNIIIVLVDIEFWNDHYDELQNWSSNYGAVVRGMTVDIPDQETLSLFCLKWA